jgi:hypothetical protein
MANDPTNTTNNFVEENFVQGPQFVADSVHEISTEAANVEHEVNLPRIQGVSASGLEP